MMEKPKGEGQYPVFFKNIYFIPFLSKVLVIHNVKDFIPDRIGQFKKYTYFLLCVKLFTILVDTM